MGNLFLDEIKKRRTIYSLGKNITQSKEDLTDLIYETVEQSPSSFNSQSSRVVILFGEEHDYFWKKIVLESLRAVAPPENFSATEQKIASFAAAFGTVLFFEDQSTIKSLQENFPLYASAFPGFSENSAGLTQFAVWNVLASEKIGASLQHYSNLIDVEVKKHWNLPESWLLGAQLPFGSIENAPGDKTYIPREGRFFTFG